MLSRATLNTCKASGIQCIQRRNFFDYLDTANRVDKGESLDAQVKAEQKALESDSSKFNWDFAKWYEVNSPQSMPVINGFRNKLNQYEQFVASHTGGGGKSNVDFSGYRNRIADPKFVDELEIQYNVDVATTKSIKNMKTLESWKQESVNSFKKDVENSGDSIMSPMSKADRDEWQSYVEGAEATQVKVNEIIEELQKDYEQIDAERMIYGQETLQMKYNEHPQWAENVEDTVAARSTFSDFFMLPFHNNHIKHERLAAMQDENRRKLFLEKFEMGSKLLQGQDFGPLGAHTGGH